MSMSVIDELIENNDRYAENFAALATVVPTKRVAILACMDARLDIYRLLGLQVGEAHVMRNAGGVVTPDVIRSLAISQRLLGTREIAVIHHSECGLLGFDDDAFKAGIRSETGAEAPWPSQSLTDLEADVRASVEALRSSPFLPATDAIRGFVAEVTTGRLHEV
jgi:carbonic anhydrase